MRKVLTVVLIAAVAGLVSAVPVGASAPAETSAKPSAFCSAFTKNSLSSTGSTKQNKKWAKSLSKAAKGAPRDVQDAIKSMKNSVNSFNGNSKSWATSPQALKFTTAFLTVSVYALSECLADVPSNLEDQLKNLGQ